MEETILKNLTSSEELKLDACDGTKTIADSKDVFNSIDSDFIKWNANNKGSPTEEIIVDVYEMVTHATFEQMYSSLGDNLEKLYLTQHQILNFIEKHRDMLRTEGSATFFLFKSGAEFFIARVRFDPRIEDSIGYLRVRIRRFNDDDMWGPARRRRVVAPRQ